MLRDSEALIDISNSAQLILNYCQDLKKDDLIDNLQKQDSVLYRLTIIGEATKRLSTEFREQNSHISWRQMTKIYNVIVYKYDKIDLNIIWKVIEKDLPQLLKNIQPLLQSKPD